MELNKLFVKQKCPSCNNNAIFEYIGFNNEDCVGAIFQYNCGWCKSTRVINRGAKMNKGLEEALLKRDDSWMVFLKSNALPNDEKMGVMERFEYLMQEKHGALLQVNDMGCVEKYLDLYTPRFERYMSMYHGVEFK